MIKYIIFKISISIAKWACASGFTLDYLESAQSSENDWVKVYLEGKE